MIKTQTCWDGTKRFHQNSSSGWFTSTTPTSTLGRYHSVVVWPTVILNLETIRESLEGPAHIFPNSKPRPAQINLEWSLPTFTRVHRIAVPSRAICNVASFFRLWKGEIIAHKFHGENIKTYFSKICSTSLSVQLCSRRPTAAKPILKPLMVNDSIVILGTRLQCDEFLGHSRSHVVTVNSDWVFASVAHVNKVMTVRWISRFFNFNAVVELCWNWNKSAA